MVRSCSDFLLGLGKIRIIGVAWDALIDPAYPETLVPNDNFDGHVLSHRKQFFIGSSPGIAITATIDLPSRSKQTRCPHPTLFPLNGGTIPKEAEADVLAEWDLSSLAAGPDPNAGSVDSIGRFVPIQPAMPMRCTAAVPAPTA